ncbi:lactonase family protein [Daejeonella sp.]|uniref:lactonase family protein n=1 Tax=Daejeonella sp. TaxID=2805397 RepID=UPI00398330B1
MKRFFCLAISILVITNILPAQIKDIIYAGTSSTRGSKGIYVFEFDRTQGKLRELQTLTEGTNPGFLALNPDKGMLYSIYGKGTLTDGNGSVMAFRIDKATGLLTKVNEQSAGGKGPAHLSVDPKGRFAYVSNYGDGTLSVLPINKDGSLALASDFIKHSGSSIVVGRQEGPHIHSAIPSADGKFIYVSDLGIDKIMIYKVDENGKLSPADVPFSASTPGAGPRHFTIHPNGNFAYSAEEISSTVASFSVNKASGALTALERVNMLPKGFIERNSAADIHFSPDGKFLYASNRGHESLVIYKVDSRSGKLSLIGHEGTGGKHPRNFMIDKKGEFALTANQNSDNIVIFTRDKKTGKLMPTGDQATVPAVTCLIQL